MGVFAVIAVFAVENVADILISRYVDFTAEVVVWIIVAAIAGFIVHEVGEDRGDW